MLLAGQLANCDLNKTTDNASLRETSICYCFYIVIVHFQNLVHFRMYREVQLSFFLWSPRVAFDNKEKKERTRVKHNGLPMPCVRSGGYNNLQNIEEYFTGEHPQSLSSTFSWNIFQVHASAWCRISVLRYVAFTRAVMIQRNIHITCCRWAVMKGMSLFCCRIILLQFLLTWPTLQFLWLQRLTG